MRIKRVLLLSIITLLFLPLSLKAQRVGLVLSGGGAKGLYHVGLLKALEENGIPIDYISGASMGAIVGAMYVSGYSPDEMLHFFATDSVRIWLTGKIPEEYRYYFKKFEPTPTLLSIRLDPDSLNVESALKLPTNIISPYRIDVAFIKMLGPPSSAANENFDSLMVPFRCVASDIYNKKTVVFDRGSLAFAVRASMTIPLMFRPVKQDSLLLYDGGVYNNFPWQTLEEDFQPDILIGGNCSGNYDNPPSDDIIKQLSVMITQHTDYSLRDTTDIIISRRFKDIGTLDYHRAAYIMALGYQDAMQQMPEILAKISRRVSPEEISLKRETFKSKIKPLIYDTIEIRGLNPKQTEYLHRQLDIRPNSGQLTASSRFEEKYMRVVASDVFSAEFPILSYNAESEHYQLKVDMQTQPSIAIALGGNISSTSLTQLYLGVNYNRVGRTASTFGLQGHLGTFYNSANISARHNFFTRFPFYIEYYAGFDKFDYDSQHTKSYYRNQAWRSLDQEDIFIGGSVAVPYLKNSAARARVAIGVLEDRYFENYHTSQDTPLASRFYYATIAAEVQNQTFNHHIYPSEGVSQLFGIEYRFGKERFTPGTLPVLSGQNNILRESRGWYKAQYKREQYVILNKYLTLGYLVEGVISNHPSFATDIASAITEPAFMPTPMSQTIFMPEYRSAAYIGVGLMPILNITQNKNLYFKSYIYAFLPRETFYEKGWKQLNKQRVKENYRLIFGANLVYQSIIGPAALSITKFTTGRSNWNISLSFGYNIFTSKKH